jgi:hypothetical protein
MALAQCVVDRVAAWWPLLGAAALLLAVEWLLARPRMRRTGLRVPGIASIGTLLRHGRPFGGGRFLPGGRGQILLDVGMLDRADVDALAILEHERGHADRDLPAPRYYRMALVAAFLAGLALAVGNPELLSPGATLMWASFVIAGLHFMRNEAAASEYALRELSTRDWPRPIWRDAVTRLAAALARYLSGWTSAAAGIAVVVAALGCR